MCLRAVFTLSFRLHRHVRADTHMSAMATEATTGRWSPWSQSYRAVTCHMYLLGTKLWSFVIAIWSHPLNHWVTCPVPRGFIFNNKQKLPFMNIFCFYVQLDLKKKKKPHFSTAWLHCHQEKANIGSTKLLLLGTCQLLQNKSWDPLSSHLF